MEETQSITPGRPKLVIYTVVILLIVGVILVILDWQNIKKILGEADWSLSFLALAFVAGSYLCYSVSYWIINNIFDIPVKTKLMVEIGFVSAALNNLIDLMGTGGHAIRLMLLKRQQIDAGQALAPSILHSHFHNLGMFVLIPTGMIYLLAHHTVQGSAAIGVGLASVVTSFFIVIATVVIFNSSLRARTLNILSNIIRFVIRKDMSGFFTTFDESMAAGTIAMLSRPRRLILLVILVLAEWAFYLVAFWCCFNALGEPVAPGILITGFAVGLTAGNVSMLPAGLGVQEASMSGIYLLLGVSVEQAALASILLRIVYEFIPFLVSIFFYRNLLRMPVQKAD